MPGVIFALSNVEIIQNNLIQNGGIWTLKTRDGTIYTVTFSSISAFSVNVVFPTSATTSISGSWTVTKIRGKNEYRMGVLTSSPLPNMDVMYKIESSGDFSFKVKGLNNGVVTRFYKDT